MNAESFLKEKHLYLRIYIEEICCNKEMFFRYFLSDTMIFSNCKDIELMNHLFSFWLRHRLKICSYSWTMFIRNLSFSCFLTCV